MLELGFLLISIIIIICVIYINTENNTENYTDYYLSSCPSGYKTFYNDGDVVCCNGEIVGNKCIGDLLLLALKILNSQHVKYINQRN